MRERNNRAAICAMVKCVCKYGSSRSSAGLSGEAPAPPTFACVADPDGVDLVDEAPDRGAVDQDVVDLVEEVAGRLRLTEGEIRNGQLQPQPNRDERNGVGSGRARTHRPPELNTRAIEVTTVQGQPGRTGKGQETLEVVVQSMEPGGEPRPPRPRPSSASRPRSRRAAFRPMGQDTQTGESEHHLCDAAESFGKRRR